MSRRRNRKRSAASSVPDERRGESPPRSSVILGRVRYEILEQLSTLERGRWLVRNPRPYPKGKMHTVILVPNNEATAQMRRSLLRLPGHATSFPSVVDHGPHGTDYFFVLEWFPGGTLENYLKRVRSGKTPRPSPTECMRLFRGLAHSLRMLHEIAQVIHGDLKPANLVLTTRPSSLRLIDFGSSWPLQRTSVRLRGDGADPVFQAPEFFLEGVRNRSRVVDHEVQGNSSATATSDKNRSNSDLLTSMPNTTRCSSITENRCEFQADCFVPERNALNLCAQPFRQGM